jgi:hypothetical protein
VITAVVVGTLDFVIVRGLLGLIGLGPAPDAKDVEIAVLRHQLACGCQKLMHQLCDLRIFVEQAAESIVPDNRGVRVGGCGGQRSEGCGLTQGTVRPVCVEVPFVLMQHSASMRRIDDEDPVQQLTPDAADKPLADRIGLHRRLHAMGTIGIGGCG